MDLQKDMTTHDDELVVSCRESTDMRALVIGIGSCGLKILHCVSESHTVSWLDTLAIDTDAYALNACNAKWKINAFSDYSASNMNGCGGDIEMGTRAVAHERNNIEAKWQNHDVVIVVGGLGGGTATGGMQTLASIAKNLKIPTIFLMLLPFAFESYARRKNANACVEELLPQVGVLVPIPADLLYSTLIDANTPIAEAFERAAQEISVMVVGLAAMLRGHNLIGTNYATLSTALHRKKTVCGIGVGQATSQMGPDRSTFALNQLLNSPFLGGQEHLEKSNTTIITLTAGPDLSISEMKRTFELVSEHFPKNSELIFGANILNSAKDILQLTALTIQYDILPNTKARKKSKTVRTKTQLTDEPDLFSDLDELVEEEPVLPLVMYNKGIFEKHQENRYKDVDLDIPTYQRRNIRIDKGT